MNPKLFEHTAQHQHVPETDPTTITDPLALFFDHLGHFLTGIFTFFQDFLNHTLAAFLF